MTHPFWEETYADLDSKSFGDASQEILELIPHLPDGCKILDLGCGDGRNSIPLAIAGFSVTAIDISETGVRKLQALAVRHGVNIHTEVADMVSYRFTDVYDLIISQGCLHLVERHYWKALIEQFREHTRNGGYNAITVFTDAIQAPSDLAALCVGLFRDGELFAKYLDWGIILQKSYTFQDEHTGGIRHTHASNKIVARNRRIE